MKTKVKTHTLEYKGTILLIYEVTTSHSTTYGYSAYGGRNGSRMKTIGDAIADAMEYIDNNTVHYDFTNKKEKE